MINRRHLMSVVAAVALVCVSASLALAQEEGAAPEAEPRNLLTMFQKGGVLMWPILLCSVVGLAFMFERTISLRRSRIFPLSLRDEVLELVRASRIPDAIALCEADKSPFAHIVHACLLRADDTGYEMEASLEEAGARVLFDLRQNGRPLGVIADVAPLLGLMGTVLGMIKAFEVVATTGALGRAELLAEGIAEALLTTAFGLCVAVPALIAHHYFRARAEGLLRRMEDACIAVMAELRRRRSRA